MRRPTKRSMGTIKSIEGARESSSHIPLADLQRYLTPTPAAAIRDELTGQDTSEGTA